MLRGVASGQAGLHQQLEFPGQAAVRLASASRIGARSNGDTTLRGRLHRLEAGGQRVRGLLDRGRGRAAFYAQLDVTVESDHGRNDDLPVLFGEGGGLIVEEAGVLDRVGAGEGWSS
ncbi:hypothetical protein [Streptomyces sp. NPDC003023]|uniref:hypothetical protein n=1 Tax=Streptomyces sp. NPDC003023 TaxID=3364675 RepID=UPI003699A22B